MTIFIPPDDIAKRHNIRLSADKSHYLLSVLRCSKGDRVSVIDGKGRAYDAEIAMISKKEVFIDITGEVIMDTESPLNLILCQGVMKGERMDIAVQKATELGIKEIIPVITERCIVKEIGRSKIKRWRKIAEEATEQCGRTIIPEIHEPIQLNKFLEYWSNEKMSGLIFWEGGGLALKEAIKRLLSSPTLRNSITPIFLLVGSEGGFTAEEVGLSEEHGLIKTSLGKRILRAETAAIVSTALVQFLLSDP